MIRTDYKLGAIVRQVKYGHAHNEVHSQVAVLMAGGRAFAQAIMLNAAYILYAAVMNATQQTGAFFSSLL